MPTLIDVLNLAREEKWFPEWFPQAIISVIHKTGKDPLKCASYRPNSLLNTDYKLVTKMIAKRLLPHLVSSDQTGFIINRRSCNNLRHFKNIIHFAQKSNIPSIALSHVAEKAFNQLDCPYLFRALKKFGFDEQFIN